MAELNKFYGLQMEAVHYRGEAPMWQDLMAGAIQGGSGSVAAANAVLQAGVGVPIAVPQTKRMSKLPNVATYLEQGVTSKAFQLSGFICLVGPVGMPQDIVNRLSDLMVEGGKSERVQKILTTFGIDDSAVGHEAFKKLYAEEGPAWIELVKGLGLTPQYRPAACARSAGNAVATAAAVPRGESGVHLAEPCARVRQGA